MKKLIILITLLSLLAGCTHVRFAKNCGLVCHQNEKIKIYSCEDL